DAQSQPLPVEVFSAGGGGGRVDIALGSQDDAINLICCPRRHVAVHDILADECWFPSQRVAITSAARRPHYDRVSALDWISRHLPGCLKIADSPTPWKRGVIGPAAECPVHPRGRDDAAVGEHRVLSPRADEADLAHHAGAAAMGPGAAAVGPQ